MTHLDLSWNDLGIEGGKGILDGMQAGQGQGEMAAAKDEVIKLDEGILA